jgi:hypothetical protein
MFWYWAIFRFSLKVPRIKHFTNNECVPASVLLYVVYVHNGDDLCQTVSIFDEKCRKFGKTFMCVSN